jgi:tRNA (cytidine/uridine-2'-O-)-methyltransferase
MTRKTTLRAVPKPRRAAPAELTAELLTWSLHIVLVEPEIHFNTGNVGRTCLATGAKLHLVEPLGFSLDDARVKRAGLDYWPAVKPVVWNSFEDIEPLLPRLGTPVFFSAESRKSYWDVSYLGPTVLVFGRESTGLSREIRDKYRDSLVSLPQEPGSVRSVNLSNAVAVAAYEVLRQRR